MNRVFYERLEEMEVELFDTGVLKKEETTNEPATSTFVPNNLETRLGTVPAVTYRPQSSSEPRQSTDKQDRLGEAPIRRTIHPRRRLGPVHPTAETTSTSRSETRDSEYQPRGATTRQELFDVVEAHTFSLAYTQTGPDEIEPSDGEVCSRCHKDVKWSETIRQRTVLNRTRGLVDSSWHKLQLHDRLEISDLEGLPSNNTMGPVNARPLQDVKLNHDEGNREERPGRLLTTRAPIGQHVKLFRQLRTPQGHVKVRAYPNVE